MNEKYFEGMNMGYYMAAMLAIIHYLWDQGYLIDDDTYDRIMSLAENDDAFAKSCEACKWEGDDLETMAESFADRFCKGVRVVEWLSEKTKQ